MKRILRFAAIFLLLCVAFRQAAVIREHAPSVSLRFDTPFTADQAAPFAAVWSEEKGSISGIETTMIRFAGDVQLVFPAVWLYGTPPNELMNNSCAVSTRLAWELYGGRDVTGLAVELGADAYTICGVFDHGEAVLLLPDDGVFTAAELFPAPSGTDLYRYGRDCAVRAGLEEPAQILCGPEVSFLAMLLPWLCLLLAAWPLLHRMQRGRRLLWVFVLLLLLSAVPDWLIPTRWSDTVFWAELGQSFRSRVHDWLTLSPALRDLTVQESWLLLGISVLFSSILTKA